MKGWYCYISLIIFSHGAWAQSGLCDNLVPFQSIDLSNNPDTTYVSPQIMRDGTCCGTSTNCVEFEVILHPDIAQLEFQIASGAIPTGSMFYQIDCGTPVAVGDPICLGGGQHTLTFCKPGGNTNGFSIRTIPKAKISADDTTRAGCTATIGSIGMQLTGITWTSIAPGSVGTYDSFLSCTSDCDTSLVNPVGDNLPAYIDYQMCGYPIADDCYPVNFMFCDTVRVYIQPELIIDTLTDLHLCSGDGIGVWSSPIDAAQVNEVNISWYDASNATGNIISTADSAFFSSAQNYSVLIQDKSDWGCPDEVFNGSIIDDPLPTIDVGNDIVKCYQDLEIDLNAIGTNIDGILWSASGFNHPEDTLFITTYTPGGTNNQLNQYNVIAEGISDNVCNNVLDTLIVYNSFTHLVLDTAIQPSCFGYSDGSISVNTISNTTGITYQWNNGAITEDLANVGVGSYQLIVTDGQLCKDTLDLNLLQPLVLSAIASATSNFNGVNISCNGYTDGSIDLLVDGGTPPYTFNWSNGQNIEDPINVGGGLHTVTITDANGCNFVEDLILTEPIPLTLTMPFNDISCYNQQNGQISANPSGGTPGYNYLWSNGSVLNSLFSLDEGIYDVLVRDANGCEVRDTVTLTNPSEILLGTGLRDSICLGADFTFSGAASGGTGNLNFQWNSSGFNGPGPFTVSPATNQQYCYTVTDDNGCFEGPICHSVYVHRPMNLAVSQSNITICENDSVIVAANWTPTSIHDEITWKDDLGNIVGNDDTQWYLPSMGNSLQVIVTNNYCSYHDTVLIPVQIEVVPQVNVQLLSALGCAPVTYDFALTSNVPANHSVNFNCNNTEEAFLVGDSLLFAIDFYHEGIFSLCVESTGQNGCVNNTYFNQIAEVIPPPVATFFVNHLFASDINPNIKFTNNSSGSDSYVWDLGDGNSFGGFPQDTVFNGNFIGGDMMDFIHTYSEGSYQITLIAISNAGCRDTSYANIEVLEGLQVYVPNAFTPDKDNINELFTPVLRGVVNEDFLFQVFDRWGKRVFETDQLDTGWDGKIKQLNCKSDVYVWQLFYKDYFGNDHQLKGHVTLVR